MADGHAVRGPEAGKIPPFHGSGETLADGDAGDVDELAGNEVLGGDLGSNRDQVLRRDTELGQLTFRLDPGFGKMTALRLRQILYLDRTGAQLHGGIAMLVDGLVRNHLALVELQHRDRHVLPVGCEHPRHAKLLCDDT